jgi:SIR2-like domain
MEPLLKLAFAIQDQPGVYALLLGSGVSRAAGIPTGWEVTLELANQLAIATTDAKPSDVAAWYEETYTLPLNYSDVVEQRAKTPAERRKLLEPFFELNETERDYGIKVPTAAHRAIAQLVTDGFIRVIITTNFDRLLERALEELGIVPDVIHTLDALHGAPPLVHSRCTIIKLHGDYKDARIKNTEEELNRYDPAWNALLDRVLDEYGLIVCGWSGDWDIALRDAITRAPNRRYSTYWASRNEPSTLAQDLISARRAQVISIDDADQFFETLRSKVAAIADTKQMHPDSVSVAVAEVKRFVAEDRHRIRLEDLIREEANRAITACRAIQVDSHKPTQWVGAYAREVRMHMRTLVAMLAHGVFRGRLEHHAIWVALLDRLANDPRKTGHGAVTLSVFDRLPAMLGLYAMGMAATLANDFVLLRKLLCIKLRQITDVDQHPRVMDLLPAGSLAFARSREAIVEGFSGNYSKAYPLSDWLCDALGPAFTDLVNGDDTHLRAFDHLEVAIALAYRIHGHDLDDKYWFPCGAFIRRRDNRDALLLEIKTSLEQEENQSPYIQSELLGKNAASFLIKNFNKELLDFIQAVRRQGDTW